MDHLDIVLALIGGFAVGWGCCALWTARWLDAMRRRQQELAEALKRAAG
jgi:hypothetical protein